MRYVHEIDDGGRWIIGDAIDAGLDWTIPPGEIWRPGTEAIGTEIAPPAPAPVPETITRPQMRRILAIRHGVFAAQMQAIIDAIPDPLQRELAQIGWESETIHRHHELVGVLGSALGLSAEQIDQDFRDAPTLGAP